MKELVIQFDYLNGPLWKDKFDIETGEWTTGITCVDNDAAIQILNAEAGKMYESLYSFDSYGKGCVFNSEKFNQIKSSLKAIVETIVDRLSTINDGSYVVIDRATTMLQ